MSLQRKGRLNYYLYDNLRRQFLELRNGAICGRTEGDLLFADDEIVSRRQCVFKIDLNDIYVEDLGSTNKTQVNSVPIRSNVWRRIQLNDVVEFGRQRLVLTNQNTHPPSNIEDLKKKKKFYTGYRNDDGSLASQATRFTKRTRLIMDRGAFRRMRLRETVTGQGLRRKIPTGGPHRASDPSIRGLAMVFFVTIVAASVGLWSYYPKLRDTQRKVAAFFQKY